VCSIATFGNTPAWTEHKMLIAFVNVSPQASPVATCLRRYRG